jgi:hypothetical protein
MMIRYSDEQMLFEMCALLNINQYNIPPSKHLLRKIRARFGVSHSLSAIIWGMLADKIEADNQQGG